MKKYFLLLITFLAFVLSDIDAQKLLGCGLFTNFLLNDSSVNSEPSRAEINYLNIINNKLDLRTYLNKCVKEPKQTIIISLYTTGTYRELTKKIDESNISFFYKRNINYKGIDYSCFSFTVNNQIVTRIVFNEPNMTLCVVFDIWANDKTDKYEILCNEIIKRISFKS